MLNQDELLKIAHQMLDAQSYQRLPVAHEKRNQIVIQSITNLLSFTDRDSYLEWAQEWIAQYQAISKELRDAKSVLRKKGALLWIEKRDETTKWYTTYLVAKALLEIRRLSKIESARQRELKLVK